MTISTLLALIGLAAGIARSAAFDDLGTRVEDFRLVDAVGNAHSLSQYSGRVVVLAFWAFKCPVSLSYDSRLGDLQAKYRNSGVILLAVDSNANEGPAEIRANASNLQLPFPVLLDGEGSLAEKLKATQTPSLYIIDGRGILRYRGALDNRKKPGEGGRIAHAEQAIDDILAGRPVATPETPSNGCPIRRRTS